MPLPQIIRDGDHEIARVSEGRQEYECDLVADWNNQPLKIGIADDLPELQKHWMLFEYLLLLAEKAAVREQAIRKGASEEYVLQVAHRLFSILVDSDLYRPISRRQAQQFAKTLQHDQRRAAARHRAAWPARRPPRRRLRAVRTGA